MTTETRGRRRAMAVVAVLALTVLLASAGGLAAWRIARTPPALDVKVSVARAFVPAPGAPPAIAAPANGSAELASDLDGVLASTDAARVRAIGSVAKTLTALVVLERHPLATGDGPVLTMTAGDVTLYRQAIAQQGSAIPVAAGERLSERQLLYALLLPSANNIAETLARWVGGSRDAFITMLNRRASALGMAHTHFADPSGFSTSTVSTAHDLVLLGQEALRNPALLSVVRTQRVDIPGLTLVNLDSLLVSEPGWLGIKTGWTPVAGGCLLFAARQEIARGAPPVTIVGAVLGQPPLAAADPQHPELGGAFAFASAGVAAALAGYTAVDVARVVPHAEGSVTSRWAGSSSVRVGEGSGAPVVMRRGAALDLVYTPATVTAPLAAGGEVGAISARRSRAVVGRWPVRAAREIPGPSLWWRLFSD